MNTHNRRAFGPGAGLVWRRQRVLWWIFVVGFVLAVFGVAPIAGRAGDILNHSLSASRLVDGYSIGAYNELSSLPQNPLDASSTHGVGYIFMIFLLFATGGILEVYRRDETLATGEFFTASSRCFWRFFRLMLLFILCLIPVAIVAVLFGVVGSKIYSKGLNDLPGLIVYGAGLVVMLLLAEIVRLWFDLAEIIVVNENEPKSRRAAGAAGRLLWRNFGSLFWLYFRISFLALAGMCLGIIFWARVVPHTAIVSSFIVSQILIVFWIAMRLWQRASETVWYQRYQAALAPAPVEDEPLVGVYAGRATPDYTPPDPAQA